MMFLRIVQLFIEKSWSFNVKFLFLGALSTGQIVLCEVYFLFCTYFNFSLIYALPLIQYSGYDGYGLSLKLIDLNFFALNNVKQVLFNNFSMIVAIYKFY